MKRNFSSTLSAILVLAALLIGISSCKDNSTTPSSGKSSAKQITSFKFEGTTPVSVGTIDNNAKTVKVTIPSGTDKTALVPTITVSDKATVSPESGAAEDFTNPVVYTVTAEDGSTADYTVTVSSDNNSTLPEELSGSMSENKTLKNGAGDIDYIIDGYFEVSGNALLTIEAGTKIAFASSNSSLIIGEDAGLKISGTAAKPVVFTGPTNNQNKGSWKGITVRSNRTDNQWDYVQIINAGGNDGALILGGGAQLSLRNCLIDGSLSYGIYMGGNSKFNEFKSNVIKNCDKGPMLISNLMQAAPFDVTSTFLGNKKNYVEVDNGTGFEDDFTLNKIDVPYLLDSYVEITGGTFTISPGVTMMFDNNQRLNVREGGIFKAEGTAADKITFTAKTQEKGFWNGIRIDNQLSNVMTNCVIEYAGKDNGQNLYIRTAKLTLTDCVIQHSANWGIVISKKNTKLTYSNVTFNDNDGGNVENDDDDTVSETLP